MILTIFPSEGKLLDFLYFWKLFCDLWPDYTLKGKVLYIGGKSLLKGTFWVVYDPCILILKGDMAILLSATPNLRVKIFTPNRELEPKFLTCCRVSDNLPKFFW